MGDTFYLRSTINTGCLGTSIFAFFSLSFLSLPAADPQVTSSTSLGAAYDDLDPQTRVVIRIGYDEGSFTSTFPTSQDWNDLTNGSCVDWDECTLLV